MFSDPILKKLVKKYPAPKFADRSEFLFEDLIESIISQQLSVKASDTIFKRFKALCTVIPTEVRHFEVVSPLVGEGSHTNLPRNADEKDSSIPLRSIQNDNIVFPSPQEVLKMSDQKMREAGISFQKISYIKTIATAFVNNEINIEEIKKMTDEEVILHLTQLKGVGKWTAEMILIFTLNRPDIFSLGDLGLRKAVEKLYEITDHKKILTLAESWKPHRSTASWYLWRSLENKE